MYDTERRQCIEYVLPSHCVDEFVESWVVTDQCNRGAIFGHVVQDVEQGFDGRFIDSMIKMESIHRNTKALSNEHRSCACALSVAGNDLLGSVGLGTHPADHPLAVFVAAIIQWPIEVGLADVRPRRLCVTNKP